MITTQVGSINIGVVTRGIDEYGMREEGVTLYIRLYTSTITKEDIEGTDEFLQHTQLTEFLEN